MKKLGDEGTIVVVSASSPSVRTRRRRLVKISDVAKVGEEGEKSKPKGNKSEGGKSPASGVRANTSRRLSKN